MNDVIKSVEKNYLKVGITLMYLQSLTASSHLWDETYPCRTEGYGETAEDTSEPSALLMLIWLPTKLMIWGFFPKSLKKKLWLTKEIFKKINFKLKKNKSLLMDCFSLWWEYEMLCNFFKKENDKTC